jgi:superfamily II DNA or RNA helicase
LHKAIEHRGIAGGSVGYYVGGMKEADLKASESRTVIIATYAMASEGLDIKTLTTLIMASPKTDVCQSVGRILRVKHGRPLVIDIVDQQDIFRNQWYKRRAYYVKQNYDILMTDSPTYDAHNPVQWTPDHVAKTKKGKEEGKEEGKEGGKEDKEDSKKPKAKAMGWAGLPVN